MEDFFCLLSSLVKSLEVECDRQRKFLTISLKIVLVTDLNVDVRSASSHRLRSCRWLT